MQLPRPQRNIMIDIETNGLNAHENAITSVAAIGFIPGTFGTTSKYHESWSTPLDTAANTETLSWREDKGVDLMEDELTHVHFEIGLRRLAEFIDAQTIIWAKPTTFDIAFLQKYYTKYKYTSHKSVPWHYRNVRDIRSYTEGQLANYDNLLDKADDIMVANWPYLQGVKHDAYADCIWQICILSQLNFAD